MTGCIKCGRTVTEHEDIRSHPYTTYTHTGFELGAL